MVDFVKKWTGKTEVAIVLVLGWLGLGRSKYYDWAKRYGKANEHNGAVPRDHWLHAWEKERIVKFYLEHPLEGYRRLTYMMLDRAVVAVSPSSTLRVLQEAGLIDKWSRKASKKGTGFVQPLTPHEHWHVDLSYLNVGGTFFYLCAVLDGYSRYIVHWELAPSMKESDVELVLQRAREKNPQARPRIISDNGPQFIARDFKEFIRLTGMTHVRTSPYYPQSNGKLERWNQSFKVEGWRPGLVQDEEQARALTAQYVRYYNEERLHSAIGYIAPKDKLAGREQEIWRKRDEQLANAREWRAKQRRGQAVKALLKYLVNGWSVSSSN